MLKTHEINMLNKHVKNMLKHGDSMQAHVTRLRSTYYIVVVTINISHLVRKEAWNNAPFSQIILSISISIATY